MNQSMRWSYRVRAVDGAYDIIECYYEDEKFIGWTDRLSPLGDSLEELRRDLEHMMRALDLPVLTNKDLRLPKFPK